jgi:bifunctional enzyme CysN/CysC
MGIRNIIVVVNKMDLVKYSETVFESIKNDYLSFSDKLNIESIHFIPISALTGENIVSGSENMKWFMDAPLLPYLENIHLANYRNLTDFRFPVQYVLRPNSSFRGYAGSIVSGIVRKGDEIIVMPSGKKTNVKSIETYEGALSEAFPPMTVVLTTEDEVDISRGMMLAKPNNTPHTGNSIETMIVWMDDKPLTLGNGYLLKSNTQTIPATIKSIRYKYDINKLTRHNADHFDLNDIGRVEISLQQPLIYDSFRRVKGTGSFILIDRNSNATGGGGIILDQEVEGTIKTTDANSLSSEKDTDSKQEKRYIFKEKSGITSKQRESLFGHKSSTIWLTGLSGSGKSTIARVLESKLFKKGIHSYILDGDNLRHGLNSDLGFSPEDRKENIRRVAEVAKLMNDAGIVVIAAFVSPYEEDRENARKIIGDKFLEVYVDADIETCRKRDPKGLYAKFNAGAFTGLTGIDAPYEVPKNPDLHINTQNETAEESAGAILKMFV